MDYEFPYVSRKWLYNPRQADLRRFKVAETTQTTEKGYFEGVFVRWIAKTWPK